MEQSNKQRWESLPKEKQKAIKDLHKTAQLLVDLLDNLATQFSEATSSYSAATLKPTINKANQMLQEIEYELQELWGFKQDSKYHTWWLRPEKCLCPKLDNRDPAFYGAGAIHNSACPLHGDKEQHVCDLRTAEYLATLKACVVTISTGNNDTKQLLGHFSVKPIPNLIGKSIYGIRHADNNSTMSIVLEPHAGKNHFGFFVCDEVLPFTDIQGYYDIVKFVWNDAIVNK